MTSALPLVLVPGLLCSARLYAAQVTALWPHGQVTIADHRRTTTWRQSPRAFCADAPPRFALAGLSMGGYIAFAMMRRAPERIARLALLDTSARPDTPEQKAGRDKFIAMAEAGQLNDIVKTLTPRFLHPDHVNDETFKGVIDAMAEETGAEAFVRQTKAIKSREDSRPLLAEIGCPTLVAGRRRRYADAAGTVERNRRRRSRRRIGRRAELRPSVDDRKAGRGQQGSDRMADGPIARRLL